MGRNDFPGSDLMIAREPQMCPPQVPQHQPLENAPQMISSSESDEKPRKRCAFPSSQLDQKGIFGFSLDLKSRLNTSSQVAPSPWISVSLLLETVKLLLKTDGRHVWLDQWLGCVSQHQNKPLVYSSWNPLSYLSWDAPFSSMTSQNLHNDELGHFTFSYSFPKP